MARGRRSSDGGSATGRRARRGPGASLAALCALALCRGSTAQGRTEQRVFVATPEQLREAMERPAKHIIIRQHLDLRSLGTLESPSRGAFSLLLRAGTRSIRGDCEGQAPGPDQPTKNQQCVITVPAGFLSLELIAQNVLISKLFIRLDRAPLDTPTARRRLHQTAAAPGPAPDAGDALQPAAAPAPAEVVQAPPPAVVMLDVAQGAAWLHEVVLKGDGQNCRGVEVGSGQRAHAHASEFLSFRKDRGAAWSLRSGARGGCRQCAFLGNTADVAGPAMYISAGEDTQDPAMAWASGGIANRNSAPRGNFAWSVSNRRSTLFSQPRMQVFVESTRENVLSSSLNSLADGELQRRNFLIASAETFRTIAEEEAAMDLEAIPIEASVGAMEEGPAADAGGATLGGGAIAGIVIAIVAAGVLATVLAGWLMYRRRRRRHCGVGSGHANGAYTRPLSHGPDTSKQLRHGATDAWSPTSSSSSYPAAAPRRVSLPPGGTPEEDAAAAAIAAGVPIAAVDVTGKAGRGTGSFSWRPGQARSASGSREASFTRAAGGADGGAAAHLAPQSSFVPPPAPSSLFPWDEDGSFTQAAGNAVLSQSVASSRLEPSSVRYSTLPRSRSHVSNRDHAGDRWDRGALESALVDMHESGRLLAGRFAVRSADARRWGSQGLVQFVRGHLDGGEYAVKFFTKPSSFEREQQLYARPELRTMMAAVAQIVDNDDCAVTAPNGWAFPPYTVMEKGEALDEWARRIKPDFPTVLMVLCHLCARLQQLHRAGVAHRDVKPANCLWRPKAHSWTLIDFGCAGEIGTQMPLSFSLTYAPPEMIAAFDAGERCTAVSGATDMWALGVIAYELLTCKRAFPRALKQDQIRAQVVGAKPLPWEEQDLSKKKVPELRMLRRSVLSLLERNPEKRPTAQQLLVTWNALFEATTTDLESVVETMTFEADAK